jgi:hypothetical protein
MNVEVSTTSQPSAKRPQASTSGAPCSRHTAPGNDCQKRQIANRHALVASTNVERSIAGGTIRVQSFLKTGRAITLCCTANSESRPTSISKRLQHRLPRLSVDGGRKPGNVAEPTDRVEERSEREDVHHTPA